MSLWVQLRNQNTIFLMDHPGNISPTETSANETIQIENHNDNGF